MGSPDDRKLHRFSMAIKEALDMEIQRGQSNDAQNNKSYLYVLRNCKIKYKINSNELKRREGDRVLSCLSSVLLKIHKNYYQQYDQQNDNQKNKNVQNKASKLKLKTSATLKNSKKHRKNKSDKEEMDQE